jgi:hypothetical protein
MQWRECIKQLFIYINNFLEFYSFAKTGCYKPTPYKMNLVPEIQTDQKRNLETWPSTLLHFPR